MNISDLQTLLADQLTDTEVMISLGGGTPVPIESVAVVTKKPREPSVVVLGGQRPKVTRSGCASDREDQIDLTIDSEKSSGDHLAQILGEALHASRVNANRADRRRQHLTSPHSEDCVCLACEQQSPADKFRCPSCLHTWSWHRDRDGCTVIACDCQQTIEGGTP